MSSPPALRFIDLFAGLGGFHLALSSLGHECVMASELDAGLRDLYAENFGVSSDIVRGDIRQIDIAKEVPAHDILCAGFPCQPFSKAGEQQGFSCRKWGDLFQFVLDVIEEHRPTYILLENVPNIRKHADGATWEAILRELRKKTWGYEVDEHVLSPHEFGIPQVRKRTFIVARRGGLEGFSWPEPTNRKPELWRILNKRKTVRPGGSDVPRPIPSKYFDCFDLWDEFLEQYPRELKLPSFPIWAMEFGASYPLEGAAPHAMLASREGREALAALEGAFGKPLRGLSDQDTLKALPPYAVYDEKTLPSWKTKFIRQNRALYELMLKQSDPDWLASWLERLSEYPASLQKLEWNYKGSPTRSLWDSYVIQIRASGIRVKRPDTAPSLVAMTTTQIPIVGKGRDGKRYMTMRECARLQDMRDLKKLPPSENQAFKALGNAVNVRLVGMIAERLIAPTSDDHESFVSSLQGDGVAGVDLAAVTVEFREQGSARSIPIEPELPFPILDHASERG